MMSNVQELKDRVVEAEKEWLQSFNGNPHMWSGVASAKLAVALDALAAAEREAAQPDMAKLDRDVIEAADGYVADEVTAKGPIPDTWRRLSAAVRARREAMKPRARYAAWDAGEGVRRIFDTLTNCWLRMDTVRDLLNAAEEQAKK